jgi:hydroxymethylpyrimidine pyrophosphatase-like HAD family hydrolase
MVKQANGIDYNEILNKIASSYKNQNSARAALSRSLKNLESFGLVKIEGSRILITGKGTASINIEMKDKLILRLNELMKKPMNDLEEIMSLLVVLSQRSSQDADMLKNAKENSSFTVSGIEEIRKKISEKKEFLTKMDALIEKQTEKLRELNFNDSFETNANAEFVLKILELVKEISVTIENSEQGFIELLPQNWKKPAGITAEGKEFNLFFEQLKKFPSSKIIIYFAGMKIIFMGEKAYCYGAYSDVSKLR